jgi:hypothetical protein
MKNEIDHTVGTVLNPIKKIVQRDKINNLNVEIPVQKQLQGMLAVFEPLYRAESKKNFEPSFEKFV